VIPRGSDRARGSCISSCANGDCSIVRVRTKSL